MIRFELHESAQPITGYLSPRLLQAHFAYVVDLAFFYGFLNVFDNFFQPDLHFLLDFLQLSFHSLFDFELRGTLDVLMDLVVENVIGTEVCCFFFRGSQFFKVNQVFLNFLSFFFIHIFQNFAF